MENNKCYYCGDYMRNSLNKDSKGFIHKKCVLKQSKDNDYKTEIFNKQYLITIKANLKDFKKYLNKLESNKITGIFAMLLNEIAIIINTIFVLSYSTRINFFEFGIMFHLLLIILCSFAFGMIFVSYNYDKLEIKKTKFKIEHY